jgi:hypothetical protein
MKRIPYNTAGVEFTAHLENIKDFLRQSYKAAHIYRLLKTKEKITMSYGAFCYHMRRLCSEDNETAKTPAKPAHAAESRQALSVRPQRQPGIIRAESKTFPDPRTMNPNDSY